MRARTGTVVAWLLWLVTFGCCAAGLLVTLTLTRPLLLAILAEGAAYALTYPLGYATIGLVLSLRRPDNPIGWLHAAAGLAWSLPILLDPLVTHQVSTGRPLPQAVQVGCPVIRTCMADGPDAAGIDISIGPLAGSRRVALGAGSLLMASNFRDPVGA